MYFTSREEKCMQINISFVQKIANDFAISIIVSFKYFFSY